MDERGLFIIGTGGNSGWNGRHQWDLIDPQPIRGIVFNRAPSSKTDEWPLPIQRLSSTTRG
jgi:hypothetical protein